MNTTGMNPWVFVRWGTVAMVYVLTLAIAMDQVKRRDRECAESVRIAEKKGGVIQKELQRKIDRSEANLMRDRDVTALEITRLNGEIKVKDAELRLAHSRVEDARELGKAQAATEMAVANRDTRASELPAAPTIQPQAMAAVSEPVKEPSPVENPIIEKPVRVSGYANPTITRRERPDAGLPLWNPPAGTQKERVIKNFASFKWGRKVDMVNYEIGLQTDALERLIQMNRRATPVGKQILAAAYKKWGNDFTMMLYDAQMESNALDR